MLSVAPLAPIPISKAAKARSMPIRVIRLAISEGSLPAYRISGRLRVRLVDLDAWVDRLRVGAEGIRDRIHEGRADLPKGRGDAA